MYRFPPIFIPRYPFTPVAIELNFGISCTTYALHYSSVIVFTNFALFTLNLMLKFLQIL